MNGLGGAALIEPLRNLTKDSEARVQFFAAQSLGKVASRLDAKSQATVGDELRKLGAENADSDLFIRQAVAIALSRLPASEIKRGAEDQSASVRMATLLALRRGYKGAGDELFLTDSDPRLVLEAARAIYDLGNDKAMPNLAKMINNPKQPEPMLYRVLNANFRLGKAENAAAVAKFAASADAPAKLRVEAVKMLGDWAKPGPRDRIIGDTRLLPPRDPKIAVDAMRSQLGGIFAGPSVLRREAATVAAKLGIREVGVTLRAMATDTAQPASTRVASLQALQSMKDVKAFETATLALSAKEPAVRAEALREICLARPSAAKGMIEVALEKGSIPEQQAAFEILGKLKRSDADAELSKWLDRLHKGDVPSEVRLDLLEAAAARGGKDLLAKVDAFEKSRPANDPLAKFRECLEGGDAERGREIFFNRTELSCVRCHQLNKVGGEVGPELAGIGGKQKRDYLLESIVTPDKQIAKGFDTVVLELKKGTTVTGVFKSETPDEVKLITPEGKPVAVAKKDIEERRRGKSAMPEDLVQKMSKRDLRDLVEFLAGLK